MSSMDIIRGENGKDYLIIDDSQLYDDEKIQNSKLEDYTILQRIGQGGFGTVYKVKCNLNNKVYAMKKLPLNSRESKEELIKNLQKSKHPNIVKYYTTLEEDNCVYIILEYVANGDLSDFIKVYKMNNERIKKNDLWHIFYQCMEGLSFLHKNNIVHGDIKPNNIFIDNHLTVKLGDFGSAHTANSIKHGEPFGRTLIYAAPEKIERNNNLSKINIEDEFKSDIYSMGATFFELLYLHPLKEAKPVETLGGLKIFIKDLKDENDNKEYFGWMEEIKVDNDVNENRKQFEKFLDKNLNIDKVLNNQNWKNWDEAKKLLDKNVIKELESKYNNIKDISNDRNKIEELLEKKLAEDKKDFIEKIKENKSKNEINHYLRYIFEEKITRNFIKEMTDYEINDRPDDETALKIIKYEIDDRYMRNANLGSLIRCLISYDSFTKQFEDIYKTMENQNLIFSKIINNCCIYNKDMDDKEILPWIEYVNEFRVELNSSYTKLKKSGEINLDFGFSLILYYLNKELSFKTKFSEEKNLFSYEEKTSTMSDSELFFKKCLFSEYNSFVFTNFCGLIEYNETCCNEKCNFTTFRYSSYFYIPIHIENNDKLKNVTNKELSSLIKKEKEFSSNFYCKNCLENQNHKVKKKYHSFPELLVIYFTEEIIYKDGKDSKDLENLNINDKNYKLISIIEYSEKKKIYFPVFLYQGIWRHFLETFFIDCNSSFYENIEKNQPKMIKMLFYEADKKQIITKQ